MVMYGIIRSHVTNRVNSLENQNLAPEPRLRTEEGSEDVSVFEVLPDPDCLSPVEFLQRAEDDEKALELLDDFTSEQAEYKVISAIFEGGGKRAEIIKRSGLTEREYEATKKRLRNYLEKKRQKEASAQHKEMEVKP